MGSVTIRQALQQVADYPQTLDDEVVNMAASQLLCRTLYDLANRPDASVRGSMVRANRARKIILERLEGKRRAGTRLIAPNDESLTFVDLTGGAING
jgi:hypothetical protein